MDTYTLVIRCRVCEASFMQGNLPDAPNLSDAEVMARAVHNPGCPVKLAGVGVMRVDVGEQAEHETHRGYVIEVSS